jgi:hypothetical protein
MTLPSLHGGRRYLAAEGSFYHVEQVGDGHAQPGRLVAVRPDFQVSLTADRVGHNVHGPADALQDGGDVLRRADHVVQVPAQDPDANIRIHAGGQHVHSVLDRHGPDVGPAWHLQGPVEFPTKPDQIGSIFRPEQQPMSELFRKSVLDRVQLGHRVEWRHRGGAPRVVAGRPGRERRVRLETTDGFPAGRECRVHERTPLERLLKRQANE